MAETKAKSINKKPSAVLFHLCKELKFVLRYLNDEKEKLTYRWEHCPKRNKHSTYEKVWNLDSYNIGLIWIENTMKLFNSTFHILRLESDGISEENFISVINWINCFYSNKSPIPKVFVISQKMDFFIPTFTKNFQTNALFLELGGCFDAEKVSEPIEIHKNLMFKRFDTTGNLYLNLNSVLSVNSLQIYAETKLTDKNFNEFFKSWQSMESNVHLRRSRYSTPYEINWDIALDGLSAVLRDPRTTRRCFRFPYFDGDVSNHWLVGGIDIQRNDGRIMTIANYENIAESENDEVLPYLIEKYEKVERTKSWNWNAVPIVTIFDGNVEHRLDEFFLFVW